AVMTTREGMSFESRVESDSAPLNELVDAILGVCPEVKALRDPTRGGLATTLNEFAASSKVGIQLQESAIPVRPDTFAACELLGIDPLYVANEGKLCAIVPQEKANAVLEAIRTVEFGENAKIIGQVTDSRPGTVTMLTELGAERIVDMPVGQQLPRIC
ncbi:MAG: hydrogenase expression/formation protein HypE, partial [bacterium]|nr:hydrogenase expression/formation protein HypE [bacterium]